MPVVFLNQLHYLFMAEFFTGRFVYVPVFSTIVIVQKGIEELAFLCRLHLLASFNEQQRYRLIIYK